MPSPAEIVRACLVDMGLVTVPIAGQIPIAQIPGDSTTVCYANSMPDDVDQGVCIYGPAGIVFGRTQQDGKMLVHHGLKLLIRALDDSGYDLASWIAINGLDKIVKRTIEVNGENHYIQSVYRTSTIVTLGEEVGKRRQRWSINARVAFQDQEPCLG